MINVGTLSIFIYCLLIVIVLSPLIYLSRNASRMNTWLHEKLNPLSFGNGMVVFIQETYLEFTIAVALNFLVLNDILNAWSNFSLIFNNLVVLTVASANLLILTFTVSWLIPNYHELHQERYKNRFGQIYAMITLEKG